MCKHYTYLDNIHTRRGCEFLTALLLLLAFPQPISFAQEATARDSLHSSDSVSEVHMDVSKPICRIGTNLLYDVITVANLNVEVGFAHHFAFNLPVSFSPWDIKSNLKFRTLTIQPELRYYFAEKFKGHYVGLEGHWGWYNIAPGKKIRYQDRNGDTPLWGIGYSYGYVLPFSGHWGMDFSVSVGYARLVYDCFYNLENGAKFTTSAIDWLGPTKVGISIYYQF